MALFDVQEKFPGANVFCTYGVKAALHVSPASWVPTYLEGRINTCFNNSTNIYSVSAMFEPHCAGE